MDFSPLKKSIWLFFILSQAYAGFPADQEMRESQNAGFDSDPRPVLAVLGLSNTVKDEEWRDARVGMGLRNVLSQLFFDSKYFVLLEEKSEIRQKLDQFASGIWKLNSDEFDFDKASEKVGQLGADCVVFGKVTYFGKPKSKVSFGPMHMNRNAVVVEVMVTFIDLSTGKKFTEEGRGISHTTARSAIFSFREDHVELDKTNVGNATRKALIKATEKILKEFRKFAEL